MKQVEIKHVLENKSARVKSVDFHPSEPWLLCGLHNGSVNIWNYQTEALVKSIAITESPVRSAKFIPRKKWIVFGSDDKFIRVDDYTTMEEVKAFEAHTDFIRSLVVHPTLPYVLSSSDDHLIKLWNWDDDWTCSQVFEGHTHYVMQSLFNPKDTNTFASASLDRTMKTWKLGSSEPVATFEGHTLALNCLDYCPESERPYIITGSDDRMAKVWDYETGACVQTLEGHTNNLSAVCFHPELPIIITGSEDGTVRIWDASSFILQKTLNSELGRAWTIGCLEGSNRIAIGCDKGAFMIEVSMAEETH